MPPSPYSIAGNLPFGSGGGEMFAAAGNPAALGQAYQSAYNTALGQNQANYNNILQGYQQTIGNQTTAQQAITGGYTNLYNDVMGRIQGVDQSQRLDIQDQYAQQQGQASQDLINRGLGNTTVQQSVNRGIALDRMKANIALSNQMAQLQANYASNIGGQNVIAIKKLDIV